MKILQNMTLEAEVVMIAKDHCAAKGITFARFMNDSMCKSLIEQGALTPERLVEINKKSIAMGGRPRLTPAEKYARAKAKLDAQYIGDDDPRHPSNLEHGDE